MTQIKQGTWDENSIVSIYRTPLGDYVAGQAIINLGNGAGVPLLGIFAADYKRASIGVYSTMEAAKEAILNSYQTTVESLREEIEDLQAAGGVVLDTAEEPKIIDAEIVES